ncbi:putative ATP-dependent RNA helicase TDRD12 [Fopius arisanus]|uniref:RNA helicase n=1 Tax=Fopius arisanus TaxID=64838 RepID=A0A0C9RX87_9HYME|nr:PREDICTED: putative ATP-dependent RNA helicase TDRD12 [Fopius arisanus]XP_011309293.1 PREDICTED: putative ATP-dependent RNA helicase TDRD12 [Fopius arisanus]XP_011309294.1 PREDICTED: putative ATP-dependent RNA helicase TDRD12 [Fopius arisanus]XP_011309295.1 PREDICTED: putative ATP-dependent RNA helicase TDRD12 [Fopius arisanus]XP_011309296.1 PREDICTED: putative ATP-dependent RNA helicase TDRD12 [Fopius arisanus]XP_011309297.1 PREDICTED: putative ATP-dependent RNA helicase TDRD12 [Fopius ari
MRNFSREQPYELPATAEEIIVFKVIDPHHIIVGNVDNRCKELTKISCKLSTLAKQHSENGPDRPENRTEVVVQGKVGTKAEDTWWYRGIVESYSDETSEYKILLPDHGVTICLPRQQFITVTKNSISDDYLTYPIGLYHIVPGILNSYAGEDKAKNYEIAIDRKWSPEAIKLTKCLMVGASQIFFDHIANFNGKKCGEIYVIIDQEVIPLSSTLLHSNFGAYFMDQDYEKMRQLEFRKPRDREYGYEEVILELPMLEPVDVDSLMPTKIVSLTIHNSTVSESSSKLYEEVFINDSNKCRRLTSLRDANFCTSIHKALKEMEIETLWKMPSYTWPAITKCCDVLIVSAKSTGKTLGYAAAIANLVVATQGEQEDNYPMVLVLCSSTDAAQNAHDIFARVLANNVEISIISAYNGIDYKSLTAKLYNGCHIFISTPAFLERYCSKAEYGKVLNLCYVRHVIFDQLDILMQKQKAELVSVLKDTPIGKRKGENSKGFTVQLIAVAEQWSTTLGKFTEMFGEPYICIGSHPDAVISCGIQPKLRLIQTIHKPKLLVELLGERYRVVKTLVVCCSRREASKLKKHLSNYCRILYVDGKSLIDEIHGIRACWHVAVSGLYPVLICTDSVLHDLRISDAEWLIHYSIGTATKSIFNFRFSSLISNLKEKTKAMEVTLILDESNDLQLRGVLDLMQRSGVKLKKDELEAADKIMLTLDRKKQGFPICDRIKAFGYCSSKFNCPYRHWILPDIDKSKTPVEEGDVVKLLLTYIHTATHFSGRILERTDFSGQVHKMTDHEHVNTVTRVNHYFAEQTNRLIDKRIFVGGLYGYKRDEGHFERVSIVNIVERYVDERPRYVDLKCIDTGLEYHNVRVGVLLELSKELREAPANIFEIFLSNVMPFDKEDEWSYFAKNCVQEWIKDNRSVSKFFQARVQLVLGNTVWIDTLDIKMKITGRRDQLVSTLKSHLIKLNHGISDDDHIQRLLKLRQIAAASDP